MADNKAKRGTLKPKTNSSSPYEERLAEYRETRANKEYGIRLDRTNDPEIFWKPAPYDPRFPNINISNYCFIMYKDFFKCRKLRGPDYEPCEYFRNVYTGICPSQWIEEWDDQRAHGCWFGYFGEEE